MLRKNIFSLCLLLLSLHTHIIRTENNPSDPSETTQDEQVAVRPRIIRNIYIHGNKTVSDDAIKTYIPYQIGEPFDPHKARFLIKNLYTGLNRFEHISVKVETIGSDEINLHIFVKEKHSLVDVEIKGTRAISKKDISKKVDFDIPAIQEQELKVYAERIKGVYYERGYRDVQVDYALEFDDRQHATAIFTVQEGEMAIIKEICFEGNYFTSAKELRKVIYTREDWVLGFMDQGGMYHPDKVEADKYMIEQFYQNHGFLTAKVLGVRLEPLEQCPNFIRLVFDIEEGDQYCVSEVNAPGNDILSEEILRTFIPIFPGDLYSREKIQAAIRNLERVWGNHGYVFAHIEPSIQPDEDTKTVKLSFHSEIGEKIILNRINIIGNKKTREKVIRRRIALQEGEQLTQAGLDISKNNIEALGYFEARDGVNWQLKRLDDETADADLLLKEMKTGHFSAQINFGGAGADISSPVSGMSLQTSLADTNLLGLGTNVNLEAQLAKEEQTFAFHLSQPYIFDKPLTAGMDIYHRRPTYDNLRNLTSNSVHEKITGGSVSLGFITDARAGAFRDTSMLFTLGVDSVRFFVDKTTTVEDENGNPETKKQMRRPQAFSLNLAPVLIEEYQCALNEVFRDGEYLFCALGMEKDRRNHPLHPSRGYKWRCATRFAFPTLNSSISFYHSSIEGHWFTPVIGEQDLVLRLHGFLGFANKFGNNSIPYNETFNIGGQATVRGYLFGEISPQFLGSPIGASKAMFVNAELVFPITQDLSMKGLVFYDGGAGFDSPISHCVKEGKIINNNFDYRHSIGFGIRLLNPAPIRIDWGFKIDPRKDPVDPRKKESSHEVHFSMSYDW